MQRRVAAVAATAEGAAPPEGRAVGASAATAAAAMLAGGFPTKYAPPPPQVASFGDDLSEVQLACNKDMSATRVSVEWAFKDSNTTMVLSVRCLGSPLDRHKSMFSQRRPVSLMPALINEVGARC